MSKIKNKEKFLISNYSFRISLFFISLFLLIILIIYSKNILSFFPKYIQKQSEEYGYVLKDIDIYGVKKISKQNILLKLSDNFDKSVFLLPLKKIEKQLIQHNNWIESLTIKIEYPSAMILNFKEKNPIAIYFENMDDYFYIDNLGRKIDKVKNPKKSNLIEISGTNSIIEAPSLINNLNLYNNLNITSAEYIGKRRWNIIVNHIIKVKLPEYDYIEAINNLSDLLIKIEDFDYKSIEFIDLRDAKKAIIRFYNNETIDLINNL